MGTTGIVALRSRVSDRNHDKRRVHSNQCFIETAKRRGNNISSLACPFFNMVVHQKKMKSFTNFAYNGSQPSIHRIYAYTEDSIDITGTIFIPASKSCYRNMQHFTKG